MNAAVTGATGFIGKRLCSVLAGEGWNVAALGRVRGTQEMIDLLRNAKADVVFHLATHFVSDHRSHDVESIVSSNLLYGTQLLEAMSLTDARRLVIAGTSWQFPVSRNLYAATKSAFEEIAQYYVSAKGIKATTAILGDTYGPRDVRPKLVNAMLHASRTGERLAMLPADHQIDLLHVDDACQGLIAASRLYAGQWQVSPPPVRLETVVKEFNRASGKELNVGWGERAYRAGEKPKPFLGIGLPGWEPKIALREGFAGLL